MLTWKVEAEGDTVYVQADTKAKKRLQADAVAARGATEMQDMKLLEVTVVTDDSTGCYTVGELDFGVPGTTADWLNQDAGNAKKLADWLRWLAKKCEARETPFLSLTRGSFSIGERSKP